MDNNNEPVESNPTSLHGLYTNFDDWIIKYSTYYTRLIRKEESAPFSTQNNTFNIIIEDIFIANILLKQRYKMHTAKQPCSINKENDDFTFYDHVLFKLLDKNSDKKIICRIIRSKL